MADIELPVFVARPSAPVTAGIVVIMEANGISQQLLRVTERLASEGYGAVAPDLFFRTGGSGAYEDYMVQFTAIDMDEVEADLTAAARTLRDMGAEKVGVTGFCMGGRYSWHAAVRTEEFDAAVGFYGSGIATDLGNPNCPTLLFFGADDPWIPREDMEAVKAHHADTIIYEGAGHGFMRDGSPDYAPEAAPDAWARTLAHFAKYLR
jgi:carboxymethylenebutenolidase